MDGQGRWRDSVFIERFWWSLEYENVYLHACDDLRAAVEGIGTYIEYCNRDRQQSSIGKLTPLEAHQTNLPAADSAPPPAEVASCPAPLASW